MGRPPPATTALSKMDIFVGPVGPAGILTSFRGERFLPRGALHMRHLIFATAVSFLALGTNSAASAAPAVHPFEQPPRFSPEGAQPLPMAATAGLKSSGCNPSGSLSRKGSVVSARLDLVRARSIINNPDPNPQPGGNDTLELRSYGGCKSGPVIEVVPGDTLRVALNNQLSTDDPSCLPNPPAGLGVPPGVGCFNTTNLHTHGLHVSPAGNSDNVLLNINPQSKFPYEINIPYDHPSGTFWYHAHRHGSTAVQVTSGGNGFLIIRGNRAYTPPTPQNPRPIADIDTILHDKAGVPLVEQLFLFQQIAYGCFQNDPANPANDWQQMYTQAGLTNVNSNDSTTYAPWTCPLPKPGAPVSRGAVENFAIQLDSPSIWDTNGRFTSINGIVQPTLTVPAGQVQRWRMVHAGIHDTINVQIVKVSPIADRKRRNLIANSALVGNRLEQKADVIALCAATAQTLIPQLEIANDGLTRKKMNTIQTSNGGKVLESNFLQPGYRSDILVAFPEEGDYCLLNQAAPPNMRINPQTGQGEGPGGMGGGQGPSVPQLLAYVRVRGGKAVTGDLEAYVEQALYDANPQLPQTVRDGLKTGDLTAWAPFIEAPPTTTPTPQLANFKIGPTPTSSFAFSINNQTYDPNVVNITRQVGTTDDWLLTSEGEPHIFHIHINPFEIIDVTVADPKDPTRQVSIYNPDGSCNASVALDQQQLANQYCGMKGVFRDTVFVENGYQVHTRTTYERYIGEFVLHCHILDHEDGGMMLNVAIVPDGPMPLMGHHGTPR
jgi:FtsP/CotA-like multicopper oxidase with cupredoxin domain